MSWVYLISAILTEVAATLSLRAAATGRRVWYALVLVGYAASFLLLARALGEGLGIGVALTALFSKVLFQEPLTPLMLAGITLIISGVVLLEVGAH